jgi:uncharacterized membrane protein YphA (DoxX/SURF4 family)
MADQKRSVTYRPRVATVTGWTILFFVVLRVAIGWHFLYEGIWKIKDGGFSSTPYLLASVGPFKDTFRSMVNDADGFVRMGVVRDSSKNIVAIKPDFQKQAIDDRVALIVSHYALTSEQKDVITKAADKKKTELDELYGLSPKPLVLPYNGTGGAAETVKMPDEELFQQVIAYDLLLKQVAAEAKSNQIKYLQQRMEFNSGKISGSRNAILARIDKAKDLAPVTLLQAADAERRAKMTPEQLKAVVADDFGLALSPAQLGKGQLPMPQATHFPGKQLSKWGILQYKSTTRTELQDLGMMFGLVAIGACLILGLFTRLAALGAVSFLAMFYLSMPPWPGVPEVAGMAEGHYLFVNKNLIELVACLTLASSRVGRWFGLDAFLGFLCERRRMRAATRAAAAEVLVSRTGSDRDRVYIPSTRNSDRESDKV